MDHGLQLSGGDRDQLFLLPPDLRDWLPDGHLAWFILDVTETVEPWSSRAAKSQMARRWAADPW